MDPNTQNQIDQTLQQGQYNVGPIQYHTHNGTDSPLITNVQLAVNTPMLLGYGGMLATTAGNAPSGSTQEEIETFIFCGKEQTGGAATF